MFLSVALSQLLLDFFSVIFFAWGHWPVFCEVIERARVSIVKTRQAGEVFLTSTLETIGRWAGTFFFFP